MRKAVLFFLVSVFCFFSLSHGEKFQFAIIGDRTGGADQAVFERVIHEMKRLHAEFAINVGDLIEGYSDDEEAVNREWDEVLGTLAMLDCPLYFVPGNHDIWDEPSERIYRERTGAEPYYSFDYGEAHFVILDNSTLRSWDDASEEMISWLKRDLEEHRESPLTFCFFHKPFWYDNFGEEDRLHDIFEEYGVDYVISGHYHHFSRASRDGIEYILIGSSGGSKGINEAGGQIYGYALATVEEEAVDVATIRFGSVLPEDALDREAVLRAGEIGPKYVHVDPVVIREGARTVRSKFRFRVENIHDEPFEETIAWTSDNPHWIITPEVKKALFAPGEETIIEFKAETDDTDHLYPLPEVEFTYPTEGWGDCKLQGNLTLRKARKVGKIRKAPAIDGKLTEVFWDDRHLLGKIGGRRGRETKSEPTQAYLVHDASHLYLGVRCAESNMETLKADAAERDSEDIFRDDWVVVFLDTEDGKGKVYEFVANAKGLVFDQTVTFPEGKAVADPSWNGAWEVAVGEEEGAWVLEIAVPYDQVGAEVRRGSRWGFNISRFQTSQGDYATWQPLITYYPDYLGELILK